MSPREKRFIVLISVVFSAIVIVFIGLYFVPNFFYITLILGVLCIACYYNAGETLYTRLGPNPRRGLPIPPVLRRWFTGRTVNGVNTSARIRNRINKADSVVFTGPRRFDTSVIRRDAVASDSFLFSPRDILMGSYIGKAESPSAVERPNAGGSFGANANPTAREQLRERLSRPNNSVATPNRRLSFGGEHLGTMSRFTITPQRHYPLQQTGTSSVGILPSAQWDGFRKKNILTPRNSSTVHSPVTVKIARPDHTTIRSPFFDHLNSPGVLGTPGLGAPVDPCSRETVLSKLKESRKREVDDEEERSSTAGQKSKRRRNDSGSSAHSTFDPLLPNGAPSQFVPKPGTMKRAMHSLLEDSTTKRSRTSSISSVGCGQSPGGTLGSDRNPIRSSYSSSQGLSQRKKASIRSLSPLSSPGSSRSQTPERVSKKPREEDIRTPSSASSARSDKTITEPATNTGRSTPAPDVPVAASSDSAGSGGKRKRKIPLVTSRRGDQISLPPPPELGYTITVKDLDQEKKAALCQIQKVLEEPAPEPEKPAPAPVVIPSSSDPTPTLTSLLAAPLPLVPTPGSVVAPIPIINLDPAPSSVADPVSTSRPAPPAYAPASVPTPAPLPAPAPVSTPALVSAPASNPLLESLVKMSSNPLTSTSMSSATAAVVSVPSPGMATITPTGPSDVTLKPAATLLAPASMSMPTPASIGQPASTMASAFTQVLSQSAKPPSTIPTLGGAGLFRLVNPSATTASSAASSPAPTSTPASSAGPAISSNPLVFKPIFGATTTASAPVSSAAEGKPEVSAFKPIFGSAPISGAFGQPSSTPASTVAPSLTMSGSSLFGGLTTNNSTAAPTLSLFTGLTNSTASTPAATTITTNPAAQPAIKSLFGNWSAAPATSTVSTAAPTPATGSTFQFGAVPTTVVSVAPKAPTTATSNNAFAFGAMTTTPATTQPAAPANTQGAFSFGQASSAQIATTASFGGFGMTSATTTTAAAPASQSTFSFGKSTFESPAASTFPGAVAAKPFGFGASVAAAAAVAAPSPTPAPAPFTFGGAATTTATTFGTPAKLAFGANSTGFAFGNPTNPPAAPAAPAFGTSSQTTGTLPAPTFSFGGVSAQQSPATPAQPASGGFNFGAAISGTQFGTPISNNLATQMPGFNFGTAAADKPAFGTSTPTFGQSVAPGPIHFGTPGTPVQGFNPVAPPTFGSPSTPSFSIGAGSKPSGARQRLQARRQHPRKK